MVLNCRKEPFVCIVNRTCIFPGYLAKDNKRNGYNDSQLPIRYNEWAIKYIMEVTAMNKYVSLDKRSKKAQRQWHVFSNDRSEALIMEKDDRLKILLRAIDASKEREAQERKMRSRAEANDKYNPR